MPIETWLAPGDVRNRLDRIRAEARRGDHEVAHSMEDAMHKEVLEAISKYRCVHPIQCAKLALRSSEIHFNRVCS